MTNIPFIFVRSRSYIFALKLEGYEEFVGELPWGYNNWRPVVYRHRNGYDYGITVRAGKKLYTPNGIFYLDDRFDDMEFDEIKLSSYCVFARRFNQFFIDGRVKRSFEISDQIIKWEPLGVSKIILQTRDKLFIYTGDNLKKKIADRVEDWEVVGDTIILLRSDEFLFLTRFGKRRLKVKVDDYDEWAPLKDANAGVAGVVLRKDNVFYVLSYFPSLQGIKEIHEENFYKWGTFPGGILLLKDVAKVIAIGGNQKKLEISFHLRCDEWKIPVFC